MFATYSPLLTDFYQLTMAYGYWRLGLHEREAVFHLLFRKAPFNGNYALCCGLGSVIDYLQDWKFSSDDLAYLATLKNPNNKKLFPKAFLEYLRKLKFKCDIDAIPEGTIVFPHEPLLRIQGPLVQCQLLETALLNIINFQTLIATKASRVYFAAKGDPIIEFGMRRAQGPDGALGASRAAYIGGCAATSNTLAGKMYDIPVRGTHAHSWVTAFSSEEEAFASYANVMPHNSVLLVDTYDTLTGVKRAIATGKALRKQGADLAGIRLDSGDLATLSIKARELLDNAGFKHTQILASNSLDEYVITELKEKGAKISAWGVGTNLATAADQPALDGVYKLAALKNEAGEWEYKIKLSEQVIKTTNPGIHQVRRYFYNDQYLADIIYDIQLGVSDSPNAVLFDRQLKKIKLDQYDACVDLLVPIFRKGKLFKKYPNIHKIRTDAIQELKNSNIIMQNEPYAIGLEQRLFDQKQNMIKQLK